MVRKSHKKDTGKSMTNHFKTQATKRKYIALDLTELQIMSLGFAAEAEDRSVTMWVKRVIVAELSRLADEQYTRDNPSEEEGSAREIVAQPPVVREVYPKSVSPWGDQDRGVVPPAGTETAPPWAVPAGEGAGVPAGAPFPRDLTMADAEALVREGMSKVGRRPGAGAGKR